MTDSITISNSLVTSFSSTSPVFHLNLAAYEPKGTVQPEDNHTLYVGNDSPTSQSAAIAGITFSDTAGVYEGDTSAWAPGGSTTGSGGVSYDYFATGAQGDSTVTMSFSASSYPQYFGFYWGSMSDGNTVTFTLSSGASIVASYSQSSGKLTETYYAEGSTTGTSLGTSTITAQTSEYFGLNVPGDSITKVVFSGADFEFSDVTYSASTVTLNAGTSATQIGVYDPTNAAYLCFLAGTRITTPAGDVPVESLKAGDMVLTASGAARKVRWVGYTTVSSRFADPQRAFPVRIAAGALDENLPARDLLVSPDHALLIDGVLIHATALVNGLTVTREAVMPPTFLYYHVELTTHDLLLAEGTPAESFVDNASRMAFDNWETHPDDAAIAEMDLPRALSARQVPAAVRARLAARVRVASAA